MTESSTRLLTTAAITACTLFLCIPVAVTTIILDNAHIPNVVLGSRTIDAGPSGSKSLTFGLRTGPDDAVLASAYIAVIASVALALCIALLRHVNSLVRMAGWTSISVATGNFAAQLGCVIAWGILVTKDEAQHAEKEDITRSENGEKYETKRMFTREAWACSMKTLYSEREGAWAPKACDDLVSLIFFIA